MKTMNFTAKEILQSLLDRSKTQTIRKAWIGKAKYIQPKHSDKPTQTNFNKAAKYEVGEEVKAIWNEESKKHWFCNVCGSEAETNKTHGYTCKSCGDIGRKLAKCCFLSQLGKVKITEVFKIKIGFMTGEDGITKQGYIDAQEGGFDNSKIARLEGFKNPNEMFKYFDENYDCSTQKEFWCYRWRWV